MNMKEFYTQCVSQSRACTIPSLAQSWPAYENWRYERRTGKEGYEYLRNKIGKVKTNVYVDEDATNDEENFSSFSFKPDTVGRMGFSNEFLPQMSKNPVGMSMRDNSDALRKAIEDDIVYPEFYHEYGEFLGLELTMGQIFMDNTHYDRTD